MTYTDASIYTISATFVVLAEPLRLAYQAKIISRTRYNLIKVLLTVFCIFVILS